MASISRYFNNWSIILNLHVNDKIAITNSHFYGGSYIELSSGMLSNNMADSLRYGILERNVMIKNCYFAGNLSENNQVIQIYAKDEWLPSITNFYDLYTSTTEIIIISTEIIGNLDNNETNNLLPFGQSAVKLLQQQQLQQIIIYINSKCINICNI